MDSITSPPPPLDSLKNKRTQKVPTDSKAESEGLTVDCRVNIDCQSKEFL